MYYLQVITATLLLKALASLWDASELNLGFITNAPLYAGAATSNYRLVVSSPCLNTGSNETWMTDALDLDGQPRLDRLSGWVDMGAYEFAPQGSMFRMY